MMSLTGALIAGGLSTRMGRDKCLIEFDGVPLWRRQLNLLTATCAEVLVVAPVRPTWCPPDAKWVADSAVGLGPLAGLTAALENAENGHVLALAVDLPTMTEEYLKKLRGRVTTTGCGVVPELDGFFQPLTAIYPREVLAVAEEHLQSADRSFQCLLTDLIVQGRMVPVPVGEGERPFFRNFNAME